MFKIKFPKVNSSQTIALIFGVLAMVLFVELVAWAVWTEPALPPPGDNVPTPINVGSTAQWKDGDLGLDNTGAISPYFYFASTGGTYRAMNFWGTLSLLNNAGTATFVIGQDGHVGIGTTSPEAKLSFAAGTTPADGIDFGGDVNLYRSGTNYLMTDDNFMIDGTAFFGISYDYYIGYTGVAALGDLYLYEELSVAGVEDSYFTGNVGIGTTTPAYKLDVSGNANATQLCIAGVCRASWPAGGPGDGNDYVNSMSFNTSNGILTLTRTDAGTLTQDLDGRYLTSELDSLSTVVSRGNATPQNIQVLDVVLGQGAAEGDITRADQIYGNNDLRLGGNASFLGEADGSSDLYITSAGNVSIPNGPLTLGEDLFIPGLPNCDAINTDASGRLVCGAGAGLGGSGAANQVAFFTGATTLSSESNLYWDSGANELGIGTWGASPGGILDLTDGAGRIVFNNNRIERWDVDGDGAQLWLNWKGYNGGTTRFRDTIIGDGKTAAVLTVDGSASRVGIGTTSPDSALHVTGGAHLNGIAVGDDPYGVVSWPYETIQLTAGYNLRFYFAANQRARLENDGDFYIAGDYYCNGVDIAEKTPSSEELLPGEVACLDEENEGSLRRCHSAYESLVAGVISTDPGLVLGSTIEEVKIDGADLTLAGRVPVKITAENGSIKVGDLLVSSSRPGYAMRGDPEKVSQMPGVVLGKQWEA